METEAEQEEELFEVEKIVGTTKVDGKTLYKVRWRGYSPCWDTFEPVENLESCLDLIELFNEQKEEMKQKRAQERKKRKALMEGRSVGDPVEVESDSASEVVPSKSSPTGRLTTSGDPDTLKDTFWRDLEQGKVNLFETDMYSKVKGRASRPASFKTSGRKESGESANEDDGNNKHRRSRSKGKASKRANTSDDLRKKTGKEISGSKTKPRKSNASKKSIKSASVAKKSECISKRRCYSDTDQNDTDSRSSNSSNSSRSMASSNSHNDPSMEQTIRSPVSLTSELKVKVERVHLGESQISPALTPSATPFISSDLSQPLFNIKQTKRDLDKKISAAPKTEMLGRDELTDEVHTPPESTDPDQENTDMWTDNTNMWACAVKREVPKRTVSVEETPVTMKKMKKDTLEKKTSSLWSPKLEEEDKFDENGSTKQTVDKTNVHVTACTISKSAKDKHDKTEKRQQDSLYGISNFTTGATNIIRNPSINITSHVDVACTRSPIRGSTELESSSRGDKFADNSPPMEVAETLTPMTDPASEKDIDPDIELDDIDPEEYDREVAEMKANPEVMELHESQFQEAVLNGDFEKVKNALNSQRSYNLESIDSLGRTLLMYSAQKGYDDIVELLVSHGARINAQQRTGTTTLMLACEQGHLCTVVLMIEMGANINQQQTSGESALMKAVKKGNKQIVRFLLERGANFASQTVTGNSAMTYAKMLHVCDVEDMLFDHVARLTAEFDRQVALTINNTAKIMCALFPLQCFPLCDGDRFVIHFKHELQPITPGVGYLLFVAHTRITSQEIKCRFYGPCAVTTVLLNGVVQPSLTEEANFVLSCCPLNNGKNELVINTTTSPNSKSKLVVCAYKAKLME